MEDKSQIQRERDITKLHLWQIQWVRDLILIVAVVSAVWLGYAMRDITVPLLVALLLAYLFEPLISYLSNHPKFPLGRVPVIAGILTILLASVLAILAFTIPMGISQTTSLVNDIQDGTIRQKLEQVTEQYAPESVRDEITQTLAYLPTTQSNSSLVNSDEINPEEENPGLLRFARKTSDMALTILGSMLRFVILAVLIPFYFFFFSLWFPSVIVFVKSLIPEDEREKVEHLLTKMDTAVAGFVRGRIVIAFIMSAILVVGWMIVGVPYAIVLGIVVGIFCAVPFLGLIGIPISVGLLFLDQLGAPEATRMAWWGIILWPVLVFVFVQALDGWILTPMIAGKATNLDPVTIFVAVLAGGSVLGAYGMLLAIPVAACIKIVLQEIVLPKVHAWARGEADDPLPFDSD